MRKLVLSEFFLLTSFVLIHSLVNYFTQSYCSYIGILLYTPIFFDYRYINLIFSAILGFYIDAINSSFCCHTTTMILVSFFQQQLIYTFMNIDKHKKIVFRSDIDQKYFQIEIIIITLLYYSFFNILLFFNDVNYSIVHTMLDILKTSLILITIDFIYLIVMKNS